MFLRHGVPAVVLDGDACFAARGLELDVDLFELVLGEAGLAPFEREVRRWLPGGDPADFEHIAIALPLNEPAVGAGIENQPASGAAVREPEQLVGLPALANLARERLKRPLRRGSHTQRNQDA